MRRGRREPEPESGVARVHAVRVSYRPAASRPAPDVRSRSNPR